MTDRFECPKCKQWKAWGTQDELNKIREPAYACNECMFQEDFAGLVMDELSKMRDAADEVDKLLATRDALLKGAGKP